MKRYAWRRFRKYFELEASATRWALNSTPSAQMAKSVSRSSRQRPASEGWCGTPPLSVSLGAPAAGGDEDEALELAAAVRARFVGGIAMFGVVGSELEALLGRHGDAKFGVATSEHQAQL